MKCPLLPCGDVVVLTEDAPVTQVGRIIVEARPSRLGRVRATGPEYEGARVGERVFFRNWIAEVEVEDRVWLLVVGDDILARVE